ncbi:MAG: 2-oxo acid dehydrogenase subunit E2 [Planctomycetes bacterium]|nr:2-oxo acid dehydrogenase subunit E2 [Planctomycetota bacterium]
MDNPTKKHVPLTRIQKLIGERMLKSKLSKPCFYVGSKADITDLMAIRPKLRKSLGVKITTNTFYIRALGLAVQKYPLAVGKFDGNNIRIAERVNVGFAVNAPQGLVVPVVKDAGEKTLPEIAREEASLTNKARDNQLKLEDIEGETIALSNLGAYGIDSFLGIVPPPTSTILAVGNVIHTPMYRGENDKITVRKIISLSLAVDRRVITETYAAEFLSFITEQLENPQRLI